jgi:hypothetical protein
MESALALVDGAAGDARAPLLQTALALAAALPADGDGAAAHGRVVAVLGTMLGAAAPADGRAAALGALLKLLPAAPPPLQQLYVGALAPDVAPLLLRGSAAASAEKLAGLKVLLLACTLAPAEAAEVLLSLTLPLVVQCMHVAADGAADAAAKELSTVAHSSFTALAKRYPAEVRAVAAGFDEGTRTRMATSLQEAAAASQRAAPVQAAPVAAAKPKIALSMNFGAKFGV